MAPCRTSVKEGRGIDSISANQTVAERLAYYCGDWIPESQIAISVVDLGFSMGVTATERLRTFRGKVFQLAAHIERLRGSLAIIGLNAVALASEIERAILEYGNRNAHHIDEGDDWSIVVFVTPGKGKPGSGASPTVCVHGFPLRFVEWADDYRQGVRLQQSEYRQIPTSCWPAELKCRSRMHYYLADEQAMAVDPNARALLLDQEGLVAETTTANVVCYSQSEGLSTPEFSKVLRGVSVGVVQHIADQLGIPFQQSRLSPDGLMAADEVWLTSTSVCMLPVVAFNCQEIGSGNPGPMYQKFLSTWSESVGVDIAAQARQFCSRGK